MSSGLSPSEKSRAAAAAHLAGAGWPLAVIFLITLAVAGSIAWRYRGQALLEDNPFRQTQTALTAYWLGENGFHLAYETPVAGAPWPTPFEFPAYQWLAVQGHRLARVPLDTAGRLLSFGFLLACLWPARALCRQLALPPGCWAVFGTFLLSSPLYLFIGRSFLIETAALFFCVAFAACAARLIAEPRDPWSALGGGMLLALGLLQKATTGLPVLAIVGLCWLAVHWRALLRPVAHGRVLLHAVVCFAVPLALSTAWTRFTADLRDLNPLGAQAPPGSLTAWIFGDPRMHYSPSILREVLWTRMQEGNAAGWFGFVVLAAFLGYGRDRRALRSTVLGLALAALPVVVFTRVHYYHEYYQASCLLYLLAALAIAAAALAQQTPFPKAALTSFAAVVAAVNLHAFAQKYGAVVQRTFSPENHGTLAVAEILKKETPPGSAFVAFGYDWSSELAYYGERKAFTVPWFYRPYRRVWEKPEEYLGGLPLGAIVVGLTAESPQLDIEERMRTLPGFSRRQVGWLEVLVRE